MERRKFWTRSEEGYPQRPELGGALLIHLTLNPVIFKSCSLLLYKNCPILEDLSVMIATKFIKNIADILDQGEHALMTVSTNLHGRCSLFQILVL